MPTIVDEHTGTRKGVFTDAWLKRLKHPVKNDQPNQWVYIETMQRSCGLMLVVSYGGSKTWRALRYVHGKPDTEKLGQYLPDTDRHVSLTKARTEAKEFWADAKRFRNKASPDSFKAVADRWVELRVEGRLRTAKDIRRRLEKYVYPQWKDARFRDIDRDEVNALLDEVEKRHGGRTADTVLTVLSSLMNWYTSRNADYQSPLAKGMQRHGLVKRDRALDDAEIEKLWKAEGQFADVCRFLLLTAQRKAKIAAVQWPDIDSNGVWTVRTVQGEKGNIGMVKLPQQALDIIARQPRIKGKPKVFTITHWSTGKRALDRELNFTKQWQLHDLRRTARTLLARKRVGVQPHIAEQVLGHAQGGIQGTYNVHEYFEEKSEALERLAAEIARIVTPPADNVVALEAKRA
jgi:integrase